MTTPIRVLNYSPSSLPLMAFSSLPFLYSLKQLHITGINNFWNIAHLFKVGLQETYLIGGGGGLNYKRSYHANFEFCFDNPSPFKDFTWKYNFYIAGLRLLYLLYCIILFVLISFVLIYSLLRVSILYENHSFVSKFWMKILTVLLFEHKVLLAWAQKVIENVTK